MRKNRIGIKRLSAIISRKECRSALDYNLHLYDSMTIIQRQVIKDMLNRNKNVN